MLCIVDDAQFLDAESMALIHHCLTSDRRNVRWLLLNNNDNPTPIINSLWQDGHVSRHELEALSESECRAVVEQVFGGSIESQTINRLHELSMGNPRALCEIVMAIAEADGFRCVDSVWQWRGGLRASTRMREIVADFLFGVEREDLVALECFAIGGSIEAASAVAIFSLNQLAALESKGHLKLIFEGSRRTLRCRHPLVAAVLADQCGPLRAMQHRVALRAARSQLPQRRTHDLVALAVLNLEIGDHEPEYAAEFIAAARVVSPDYELRERLGRAAFDRGGGFEALEQQARALFWQGRLHEAQGIVASMELHEISQEQRSAFAAWWRRMIAWGPDRSADVFAFDPPSPLEEMRDQPLSVRARHAAMLTAHGESVYGVAIAETVLNDEHAKASDRCWAGLAAGLAYSMKGESALADTASTKILAAARETGDLHYLSLAGFTRSYGLRMAGEFQAAHLAALDLQRATGAHPSATGALAALLLGLVELDIGNHETASHQLREAIAGLGGFDPAGWVAQAGFGLAWAFARRGRIDEARVAMVSAEANSVASIRAFEPDAFIARAWLAASAGDRVGGVQHAVAAADLAVTRQQPALAAIALQHALRLGGVASHAQRIVELCEGLESPRMSTVRAYAQAKVDGDGDGDGEAMMVAAHGFAAIGLTETAMDTYAQAGVQLLRAGDNVGAIAATGHANLLEKSIAHCIKTPAMEALSPVGMLTLRQRQIAQLAAGPNTSRMIALELGISERTVESHLDAIYRRLGIAGRAELNALVGSETG